MDTGDIISFKYNGRDYSGIYINESNGFYTLKLSNGYNIIVDKSDVKIEAIKKPENSEPSKKIKYKKGDKKLVIMTTGGTIGSTVDYSTGAVKPVKDPEFIYNYIPYIDDFDIKYEVLDNMLSENVTAEKMMNFARRAYNYLKENIPVLIFHGTDTMQYTASALAFMFEKLSAPVIFVGSQRSPDRPSSDAFINIGAAANFSLMDLGEVSIAMHSYTSDIVGLSRAVRTRKMHTSRRDAFKPIDDDYIAFFDGKLKINENYKKRDDETILMDKLNDNVSIVYFYPGMKSDDFSSLVSGKDAVIIMGTGLGHVSDNIIEEIKRHKDTKFFMTSQCIFGNTNLNVYSTGRKLIDAGVISLGNMLPETAYVKAMYILGSHPDKLEEMMLLNLRGELSDRILLR
ncbi:Glu-tRNA(Gln) amidotransferase subunit GatD [Picrophilus oshimae]|uniref:Glutamyl-tRNA(Gln) amidotransferase subunit D n=1 Tax=Picrophilus torridus (strain ATCC 700027 / DSM 9790 / JCM 10055 / NBRC 100828 / KAW 2/3) TaxID=1122961 RepID=A0A8G2FWT2_PICTO|nr:Glu-tRNA(Gln) amidotransferase subunit GatD [Picrophilus oshimae]SMD30947.1 glutamyl-tRNA(Gln) amidotransferase subunit D [Picrophilus oshimae DSM 9789]